MVGEWWVSVLADRQMSSADLKHRDTSRNPMPSLCVGLHVNIDLEVGGIMCDTTTCLIALMRCVTCWSRSKVLCL